MERKNIKGKDQMRKTVCISIPGVPGVPGQIQYLTPRATVNERDLRRGILESPSGGLLKKYNPFSKRQTRPIAPTVIDDEDSNISERSCYSAMAHSVVGRPTEKIFFQEGSHLAPKDRESGPQKITRFEEPIFEMSARHKDLRLEKTLEELKKEITRAIEKKEVVPPEVIKRLDDLKLQIKEIQRPLYLSSMKSNEDPASLQQRLTEKEKLLQTNKTTIARFQTELNKKQRVNRELQNKIDSMEKNTKLEIEKALKQQKEEIKKSFQRFLDRDYLSKCQKQILHCRGSIDDFIYREQRLLTKMGLLTERLQLQILRFRDPSARMTASSEEQKLLSERHILEIKKLKLEYSDQIHSLKKQIAEYEEALEEKSLGILAIQEKSKKSQTELNKSLEYLQNELEKEKVKKTKMETQEMDFTKAVEELQTLHSQVDYYEQELANSRRLNDALKEKIFELEKNSYIMSDLNKKIEENEEEIGSYKRVNDTLRAEIATLQKQQELMREEIDNDCVEKNNLQELLESYRKIEELNPHKKEIEDLKKEIFRLSSELAIIRYEFFRFN